MPPSANVSSLTMCLAKYSSSKPNSVADEILINSMVTPTLDEPNSGNEKLTKNGSPRKAPATGLVMLSGSVCISNITVIDWSGATFVAKSVNDKSN